MDTLIRPELELDIEEEEATYFDHFAEKLRGFHLDSSLVYAPAVERDGITVIPVARFFGGAGGGYGFDENKKEKDSAGGAGGIFFPVGYIELKNGEARFRPIYDVKILLRLGLLGLLLLLVLRRRGK